MKTLLLLILLFQPIRWKYIVFFNTNMERQGAMMYDEKGKPVEPKQDRPEWRRYATSRQAHRFYDSLIVKRNLHDNYHGFQITKVWIDSIPVK